MEGSGEGRGRTYICMHEWTEDLPHCVVQDCVPFGAAAQKATSVHPLIGPSIHWSIPTAEFILLRSKMINENQCNHVARYARFIFGQWHQKGQSPLKYIGENLTLYHIMFPLWPRGLEPSASRFQLWACSLGPPASGLQPWASSLLPQGSSLGPAAAGL